MEHRIKEVIKEKGYTITSLADKLGIARESLSRMIVSPSYPTLEKISTALNVAGNCLRRPKKFKVLEALLCALNVVHRLNSKSKNKRKRAFHNAPNPKHIKYILKTYSIFQMQL